MQVCEALADETRVRIVELLAARDLSAGELAAHFTVSRPAVSRHLRVLREAGLTTVSRDAQRRVYRLNPAPLRELEAWIAENRRFWEPRLDALGTHLDEVARSRAPPRDKEEGPIMTDDLATFDDALTSRYVRNYPHPTDLVWEAVTSAEHLDIWLAPACGVVVEPRLGGRCEFWFGGPNPLIEDHEAGDRSTWAHSGTITEFMPPRVVHYQLAGSALRFELTPIDGGTQLVFLHSFSPDFRAPQLTADADDSYEAPRGPDSPWRPGFMAGFHVMLRQLGAFLDGSRTAEDTRPYIEAVRAGHGVHELMRTLMTPAEVAEDERLAECYRARIREELAPRA